MKQCFYIMIILAILMPAQVSAEEPVTQITFASEEWKNATHSDGTGLYWDIFREVYEPEGIKINPIIRSYSGSVAMVKRQKADAVVGAYIDEIQEAYYPKWHFAVDVVQVIFKKDKIAQWKGQESLKGKKVSWIKGYALDEYLDVPVEKNEFEDRKGALRALDKGRYDFFMDAQGDLIDALKSGIIDTSKYRIETVKQLNLYLAFVKNDKGKKYQEIFDKNFPKLVESGKIKALYDKWKNGNFTYPFEK